MSAGLLILIGALLCFVGAWSTRIVILAGGFGASWLIANAFGASTTTTILVSVAGALGTFVITLLMSRFLLFITGCVIGAVIGARLFVLLSGDDDNVLLAVVFVPAVSVVCGFLAQRYTRRFVMWGTAFAGAGLILSGLGLLGPDSLEFLRRPGDAGESTGYTLLWLALAVLGQRVQRRGLRDRDRTG
ncbi:MAG: hypothetical protein ABWZ91_16965 [Nocardioides sp.]